MSSFSINLPDLYNAYKNWVIKNPQTASEVELMFKWISYFVAGKINKSVVLTELVYSVSNLLVLFNDFIIHSSKRKLGTAKDKIKIWLTVLEYSEVFIEISAKSLWGQKGKWIIITCVEVVKCVARLVLVLQHKDKMLSCPRIPPAKRNQTKAETTKKNQDSTSRINNVAFSLKRSGRVIRKVDAAPPLNSRLWKPPSLGPLNNVNEEDEEEPDRICLRQHLTGEILYIIKPIVHLLSISRYGQSTWKPWCISLAMDLTSLYLLHSGNKQQRQQLTDTQRLELSRRYLALILYLMRSPFYERHSENRVNAFLDSLSNNIPLARLICNPIKQYIPYWQETYFYVWSS